MKLEINFEMDQAVTHKRLPVNGSVQGASIWRNNTPRVAVSYTDTSGEVHTEWFDADELLAN